MKEYTADLINSYTLKSVYHKWWLDDLYVLPLNMKVTHMYLGAGIYMWKYSLNKAISFLNRCMYLCCAGNVSITLVILGVYNVCTISSASVF